MESWSSRFDWQERIKSYDAWREMEKRNALAEYEPAHATVRVARQEALFDRLLTLAEKAAEQMEQMVDWPLAEQTLVRLAENGEMAVYVIRPAGWNKNTVKYMFDIVSKLMGNGEVAGRVEGSAEGASSSYEPDLSKLTDEEQAAYKKLVRKLEGRT